MNPTLVTLCWLLMLPGLIFMLVVFTHELIDMTGEAWERRKELWHIFCAALLSAWIHKGRIARGVITLMFCIGVVILWWQFTIYTAPY